MATAPEVAVRNALASYLRTALSLAEDACEPDWFPATQSLPHPTAISVHDAGPVEYTSDSGPPVLVSITPGSGAAATAIYRLGEVRIPLAIDLWCATQKSRDDLTDRLDDLLNRAPSVAGEPVANALSGLTLACGAEYFAAVVTFDSESRSAPSSPEGATREEWRAIFQVTARVDHLRQREITRQTAMVAELAVGTSVDPAGAGDTENVSIFTGG